MSESLILAENHCLFLSSRMTEKEIDRTLQAMRKVPSNATCYEIEGPILDTKGLIVSERDESREESWS